MTDMPIGEALTAILSRYEARGRAKGTRRQIKQVFREIQEVGVTRTSEIDDVAIERWLSAWPERTWVTTHSHLRCLSAACTILRRKRWIEVDPFAEESPGAWMREDSRPRPPKRKYAKTPDEVRRLLRRANLEAQGGSWEACRLQAYVHTLFLTGGRPGEIQRLEVADFDRARRTLMIEPKEWTNSKGRIERWRPKTVGSAGELPIGGELASLLVGWTIRRLRTRYRRECRWLFPGETLRGPWTSGGKESKPLAQIKALAERAGVGAAWQKSARKGIGTHHDIGMTPGGRRLQFRHADESVGDRYDERQIESRRADAAKIERFYLQ